jgi:hypothetical protein
MSLREALGASAAEERNTDVTLALRASYPLLEMEPRRLTFAGLVLLATSGVCLWASTYQQFAPVGLVGIRATPYWAVPMAIGVGIAGALLALLIYRHGRPADKRGRLLLWALLSALLLAFGSPGPWLSLGVAEDRAPQHALVLVAAVVGAVLLVALRQRRAAGGAALLAGLVGLGITLYAATHLSGLLLYGPAREVPKGFGAVGWELDLAVLGSVSLALCGLVWLLTLADPRERARLADPTPAA